MKKFIKSLPIMLLIVVLCLESCITPFAAGEVKTATETRNETKELYYALQDLKNEAENSNDADDVEEIEALIDKIVSQYEEYREKRSKYIKKVNSIFKEEGMVDQFKEIKSPDKLEKYSIEFIKEKEDLISFYNKNNNSDIAQTDLAQYVEIWEKNIRRIKNSIRYKHKILEELLNTNEDVRTEMQQIIEKRKKRYDTVRILNKPVDLPAYKKCDNPNGSLVVPKGAYVNDSTGEDFIDCDGSNEMYTVSTNELFLKDPSITDICQQHVGDCYFLAALGSIASSNPDLIKNSIIFDPKENTAIIRFFDDEGSPYYYKIDASIPKSHMRKGTIWPKLFEKAYILHRERFKEHIYNNSRHNYSSIKGGHSELAAAHLTPVSETAFIRLSKYSEKPERILKAIKKCLENNDLIFTDFHNKDIKGKTNLYARHAYSIIGVETQVETKSGTMDYIILRNPHGDHVPEYFRDRHGKPKLQPSSTGKSGQFKLKFDDFMNIFNNTFFVRISK